MNCKNGRIGTEIEFYQRSNDEMDTKTNKEQDTTQQARGHYTMDDYLKAEKYDVHTHVLTDDPRFIEHAREDLFSLISINVDVHEYPSLEEQRAITKRHADAFPKFFSFSTSFRTARWNDKDWLENTLSYLSESISKGAIAVKVWKNIGGGVNVFVCKIS